MALTLWEANDGRNSHHIPSISERDKHRANHEHLSHHWKISGVKSFIDHVLHWLCKRHLLPHDMIVFRGYLLTRWFQSISLNFVKVCSPSILILGKQTQVVLHKASFKEREIINSPKTFYKNWGPSWDVEWLITSKMKKQFCIINELFKTMLVGMQ